jgi:hypothetical protein
MHGDTRHYSILRKVSTVNISTCHSNAALHCMQHLARVYSVVYRYKCAVYTL